MQYIFPELNGAQIYKLYKHYICLEIVYSKPGKSTNADTLSFWLQIEKCCSKKDQCTVYAMLILCGYIGEENEDAAYTLKTEVLKM